jgi:hypothetical protein
VRLVVIDPAPNLDDAWTVCCGGDNFTSYDESYIRDDVRERPHIPPEELYSMEKFKEQKEFRLAYDKFHFPDMHAEEEDRVSYRSVPYLAAMTIGSTGWSGYSQTKSAYWYCTYESLTDEGKALYDLTKKLYTGCNLYLQTWLDT